MNHLRSSLHPFYSSVLQSNISKSPEPLLLPEPQSCRQEIQLNCPHNIVMRTSASSGTSSNPSSVGRNTTTSGTLHNSVPINVNSNNTTPSALPSQVHQSLPNTGVQFHLGVTTNTPFYARFSPPQGFLLQLGIPEKLFYSHQLRLGTTDHHPDNSANLVVAPHGESHQCHQSTYRDHQIPSLLLSGRQT